MPKCIVFGVDGASTDLTLALSESGRLSNIQKLLNAGCWARSLSVVPWQTAPAWTSYSMGVGPGKHGIFGWWEAPIRANDSAIPVSCASGYGRIWEILSSFGVKVGVVNVPMSFPATPVNGFLLSGFCGFDPTLTVGETRWAYPRSLVQRLSHNDMSYCCLPDVGNNDFGLSVKKWMEHEKRHCEITLDLIKEFNPDFLQINFLSTDWVSHKFGPNSKEYENIYQHVDDIIGRILSESQDVEYIFIISDHGSHNIKNYVLIHNVLMDAGLLSYKEIIAEEQLHLTLGKRYDSRFIGYLLDQFKKDQTLPQNLFLKAMNNFPGANLGFSTIDWDKSVAYSLSDYGHVSVNQRYGKSAIYQETSRKAVMREIMDAISTLRDPHTGEKIISSIHEREEVYWGDKTCNAPDVIPYPVDYSTYFCQSYGYYTLGEKRQVVPVSDLSTVNAHYNKGDHDPFGLFIAAGTGVNVEGPIADVSLLDMLPTILRIFDVLPFPEHDGVAISEIWDEHRSKAVLLHKGTPSLGRPPARLKKQLRELGYQL